MGGRASFLVAEGSAGAWSAMLMATAWSLAPEATERTMKKAVTANPAYQPRGKATQTMASSHMKMSNLTTLENSSAR